MKSSNYLKDLILSLKGRLSTLDYNLIVDPKEKFEYEEIISEMMFDLLSVGIELRARKRRKK